MKFYINTKQNALLKMTLSSGKYHFTNTYTDFLLFFPQKLTWNHSRFVNHCWTTGGPLERLIFKNVEVVRTKTAMREKKIFKLFTRLGYICKKDTRMDKFTILNFSQLEDKILVTSSHSHPKTHPGKLWGIKLPCYPATKPIYFGIFSKNLLDKWFFM